MPKNLVEIGDLIDRHTAINEKQQISIHAIKRAFQLFVIRRRQKHLQRIIADRIRHINWLQDEITHYRDQELYLRQLEINIQYAAARSKCHFPKQTIFNGKRK